MNQIWKNWKLSEAVDKRYSLLNDFTQTYKCHKELDGDNKNNIGGYPCGQKNPPWKTIAARTWLPSPERYLTELFHSAHSLREEKEFLNVGAYIIED